VLIFGHYYDIPAIYGKKDKYLPGGKQSGRHGKRCKVFSYKTVGKILRHV